MAESAQLQFAFQKRNYMLLLAGMALLIVGYMLMSGGGSADPNVFSEEIFSFRRITLSPIVIILGYIVVGVAIMHRPKKSAAMERGNVVEKAEVVTSKKRK